MARAPVRHCLLDEIRVIKVKRPYVAADEELKSRFLEEAKTATRLKHRNIATIHDFALSASGARPPSGSQGNSRCSERV
jgi:hypothetical protein